MEEIGIGMIVQSPSEDKTFEEEKIAINNHQGGEIIKDKDRMKNGVIKSMMKMIMKPIKMTPATNLLKRTKMISRKVVTEIMKAMRT